MPSVDDEMLIAECSVDLLKTSCAELMRAHHAEIETIGKLDMDWKLYRQLEDANAFFALVAIDKSGGVHTPKGYALCMQAQSMHEAGVVHLMVDAFYLAPELRRGHNGLRFIREIEDAGRERGCHRIVFGVRRGTAAEVMLKHRRYTEREAIYVKDL